MEPYSINFGWIIRTSTRTSALLVVGWGNHTIFTFSSCVFSQPDQPNIKRWVPSKFKTLERADRFFWEFYFLVLTHQCWRIARSLNDLGVPPQFDWPSAWTLKTWTFTFLVDLLIWKLLIDGCPHFQPQSWSIQFSHPEKEDLNHFESWFGWLYQWLGKYRMDTFFFKREW